MKEKICGLRPFRMIGEWKLWKWAARHPFFGKFCNYEMITYIVCGVLTTILNYVVYFVTPRIGSERFGIAFANVTAWLVAVIFAYFVNKIFVFESMSWDRATLFREFLSFITARLLSLGFDTLFLIVTVGYFKWNEPAMKILSNVFVLIMNYIASKFLIFKKADTSSGPEHTEV